VARAGDEFDTEAFQVVVRIINALISSSQPLQEPGIDMSDRQCAGEVSEHLRFQALR
jgi:hypothetical protein